MNRIEWLDAPETAAKPDGAQTLRRVLSLARAVWLVTLPLIVYVAVPILFLITLVVGSIMLRLHPLLGGAIVAIGFGLGMTLYYDIVN